LTGQTDFARQEKQAAPRSLAQATYRAGLH
jgi:hypothetical protein